MNRQLKLGNGLVLLACLMVLLCMNQRAVGERLFAHFSSVTEPQTVGSLLAMPSTMPSSTPSPLVFTDQGNDSDTKLSSCELSAKSLMTLTPVVIEPFFFMFLSLAALMLFCTNLFISRANSEEKHAPPRVRRHLQFCNLRN